MYQLLKLIHSYRAFLVFLFLLFICSWLLIRNNPYHSAAYFHTSNSLIGNIYLTQTNISQYFNLPKVNEELARDNALLREQLSQSSVPIIVNSNTDSLDLTKSISNYGFLFAKVINNSTRFTHNYLTINKGRRNGVEKGMGIISSNGIVGKVMSVSDNFSTVSSLLNTEVYVSAYIKRNKTFGSIKWDGRDALSTKLLYIPRHIELQKGDTIVTSGFNSVFPEKIPIGFVDNFEPEDDSFYSVDVALANDFSNLSFVYIVKNPLKAEKEQLENEILISDE